MPGPLRESLVPILLALAATPALAQERRAHEQGAIKALTKLFVSDNRLIFDEKAPGKPVIGVDLANNYKLADADLTQLKALPDLETLDLRFCEKISDKGMAAIKSLTKLKDLKLASYLGVSFWLFLPTSGSSRKQP